MNVLIVDDEKLIRDVIKEYAISEGYHIFEAEDGEMALDIIETNKIDVIVLDIMMPKLDGFSTYKEIKKIKNIPTIILSARSEEYDKLLGFELDVFEYQDLKVDFKGYTIKIDDKEVKVTPKEFEILTYFIKNKNVAISRESLLSSIWGYDFFGDDRTIDTHVKMLRNNLGKYRDLIITVRGIGYKFEIKEENTKK